MEIPGPGFGEGAASRSRLSNRAFWTEIGQMERTNPCGPGLGPALLGGACNVTKMQKSQTEKAGPTFCSAACKFIDTRASQGVTKMQKGSARNSRATQIQPPEFRGQPWPARVCPIYLSDLLEWRLEGRLATGQWPRRRGGRGIREEEGEKRKGERRKEKKEEEGGETGFGAAPREKFSWF